MKKLFAAILVILLSVYIFPQDPNWMVYTHQNSHLPNVSLYEIAIDKNDIKWILGYSTLIEFDWTNWQVYDSLNSIIPSEWGGIISKGGDGNVWMGGYGNDNIGLVNVSVTPWEIYDTLNSLIAYNQIAGLSPSRDGGIWINSWPGYLTYGGTVQKFTNGNWYNLTQQTINYIDEMEEDLEGNLWYVNAYGGSGGVFKIVSDTTIWYHFLDGVAFSLETDLNGNVWMGWARVIPDSSGLLKYNGVDWEFYNRSNSNLPVYWVTNLVIDSLGNLWMSGNGLIKFDGMDFTHYTPQNSGLYSTNIRDIQIDEHKNKWIIHPDAISVFNEDGIITVIDDKNFPTSFTLYQNYPNPFNPSTKIKYTIPSVETRHASSVQNVTLKVYDVLGNEIATLVNEEKLAGEYEVEFGIYSDEGQNLSSGIYFYQLRGSNPETSSGQGFVQTRKMVLLR